MKTVENIPFPFIIINPEEQNMSEVDYDFIPVHEARDACIHFGNLRKGLFDYIKNEMTIRAQSGFDDYQFYIKEDDRINISTMKRIIDDLKFILVNNGFVIDPTVEIGCNKISWAKPNATFNEEKLKVYQMAFPYNVLQAQSDTNRARAMFRDINKRIIDAAYRGQSFIVIELDLSVYVKKNLMMTLNSKGYNVKNLDCNPSRFLISFSDQGE